MTRKNTIRDLAREAGVSVGTASRVINGSANVTPDLRDKVARAIVKMGFEPNAAAQSMRNGASRTIGIVISDITVHRMATFVRAAQAELEAAGYGVFAVYHQNRKERERELLQFLTRRRVEGLIRSNCADKHANDAATPPVSIPMVLYDREALPDADAVRIAHQRGMQKSIELLAGLGHRRIALVTGPEYLYPSRARIEGYRQGLAAEGLAFEPDLLKASSFEDGFLDVSLVLGLSNRPTALILGGAGMLPGALQAINALGLSIPRDLSLIGAGDSDLAQFATPAVTVVRWDIREAGRASAQVLLERLEHRQAPFRSITFEPELIVRGSCAAPAAS